MLLPSWPNLMHDSFKTYPATTCILLPAANRTFVPSLAADPTTLIMARFIDILTGSLVSALGGWILYNEKLHYLATRRSGKPASPWRAANKPHKLAAEPGCSRFLFSYKKSPALTSNGKHRAFFNGKLAG